MTGGGGKGVPGLPREHAGAYAVDYGHLADASKGGLVEEGVEARQGFVYPGADEGKRGGWASGQEVVFRRSGLGTTFSPS